MRLKSFRIIFVGLLSVLMGQFLGAATQHILHPIPIGSEWKYISDGTAPTSAWKGIGYDDTSWPTGTAKFEADYTNSPTVVTSYFRSTFQLENSENYSYVLFNLLADDGAVIYINGQEVVRQNLPEGNISNSTLASDKLIHIEEQEYRQFLVMLEQFPDLLVEGENVIGVEVHQASSNDDDMVFDAGLAVGVGDSFRTLLKPLFEAEPMPDTYQGKAIDELTADERFKVNYPNLDDLFVPAGSQWKFWDAGNAPPANWMDIAFDDTTWGAGAGELGYGDGNEATTINSGVTAAYFRREFDVADAAVVSRLLLRIKRDDGVVAYLNGQEVFRDNMPSGSITYDTWALENVESTGGQALEDNFYTVVIDEPASKLMDGTNILAVEVHQHQSGNSDMSFDAQLIQNGTIESYKWIDFHDGRGFRDPFGDSPETREHTTLNDFVDDMRGDPVALAAYVQNEIELADSMRFHSLNDTSIPSDILPPRMNRGAYATFMEGRGSPYEQSALLVYLLRRAGYAAAYVDAPNKSLRFKLERLSNMLRLQLRGFGSFGTNDLTSKYNATWVVVYDEQEAKWKPLFPWLKDTVIEEGFDLYDHFPEGYRSSFEWVEAYLRNDPKIHDLVLDDGDDTACKLMLRFIDKHLAPLGLSRDDVGVKIYDRKSSYYNLDQFPRPFFVANQSNINNNLNLNKSNFVRDYRDSSTRFSTIKVTASQTGTNAASLTSADLKTLDLHNRKFVVYFKDGKMHLRLAPFDPLLPIAIDKGAFNVGASSFDASAEQHIISTSANNNQVSVRIAYSSGHWGAGASTTTRYMYAGSIGGICIVLGQVSEKMLEVHAREFWDYKRTAREPDPAEYASAITYLTGMNFFHRNEKYKKVLQELHKVYYQSFGLGMAVLEGGDEGDLSLPRVDMPTFGVPNWNNSIYPASGFSNEEAIEAYGLMSIADSSSHEHEVLDQLYSLEHSISTVKLLQIDNRENSSSSRPDGFYSFNRDTLPKSGSSLYNNNEMVRTTSNALAASSIVRAYVTSSSIGSEDSDNNPSYEGYGSLYIGANSNGLVQAALISSNKAGGNGTSIGNTFNPSYFDSLNLNSSGGGNYNISFSDTNLSSSFNNWSPSLTSSWDVANVSSNISTGFTSFSPDVYSYSSDAAYSLGFYDSNTSSNFDFGDIYTDVQSVGLISTSTSSYNNASWSNTFVADPVNVTTGEFYVDASDLTLPGPFPLTMRRNYSSLNQAPNEFGYGWNFAYVPYLSVTRDPSDPDNTSLEPLIYAADPDGSVVGYRLDEDTSSYRIWRPTEDDNPNLRNYNGGKIGSLDNPFLAYIKRSKVDDSETQIDERTIYQLYRVDGSVATYHRKSFTVNSGTDDEFTWARPYIDRLEDAFGNYFTFAYGENDARPSYGHMTRVESSNGSFLGFYYNTTGQITEAYTGDGRRLYYDYSDYGDLTKVTLPDNSEIRYEYLIGRESQADEAEVRGDFVGKSNRGNKYGTRVRGWIEPDSDDTYTFFIKCNDQAQLWLSTDENPENKQRVIDANRSLSNFSNSYKHTVSLKDGQRYYVEVLHKEKKDGDYLSVGWSTTGSPSQAVTIPEANLIPWNPVIAGSSAKTGLLWEYWDDVDGSTVADLTKRIEETVRPYSTHLLTRVIKPDGRILENEYEYVNGVQKRRVTLQRNTVGETLELVDTTEYLYDRSAYSSWTDKGYKVVEVKDLTWPNRKPSVGDPKHSALSDSITTYIFDENDRLLLIADPLADKAEFSSAPATLEAFDVEDYGDHILAYEWNSDPSSDILNQSVSRIKDKSGLISEFSYDAQGNPNQVTLNGALTGAYSSLDALGRPALESDESSATYYYYNARNQLVMEVSEAPGQSSNNFHKLVVHEFPDTGTEHFIVDARDSSYLAYAYRSLNSKSYSIALTSVDPNSMPNVSGHTPVATTQNFFGSDISGDEQAHGLLKRIVNRAGDSNGAVVSDIVWQHDSRGYPTGSTQVLEGATPDLTTGYSYDGRGQLVAQTDASGVVTRFAYDDMGRLKWEERYKNSQDTTPDTYRYLYYNLNGDVIWEDGPRSGVEDYVFKDYDGNGRLVTKVVWRSQANVAGDGVESSGGSFDNATPGAFFNEQSISFYEYDGFGNLVKEIDPLGNETYHEYDAMGRRVTTYYVEDFEGSPRTVVTTMDYDAGGRIVSTKNPKNGKSYASYTSSGLPVFESSPDGARFYTKYYADGRVAEKTLPNGAVASITYDDVDLSETSELRANADEASKLLGKRVTTFDLRGKPVRRLVFTQAGGAGTPLEFTTTYDYAGRVVATSGPDTDTDAATGAVTQQQSTRTFYLHDASANQLVTTVRAPINSTAEFPAIETVTTQDHLGRIIDERVQEVMSDNDASPKGVRVTKFSYSDDKQSVTVTKGTNAAVDLETITYTDTMGNPVLVLNAQSGLGSGRVFTKILNIYDAAGNMVSTTDEENRTTRHQYDSRNRLKLTVLPDDAEIAFKYDELGQLTHRIMPGGLTWRASYTPAGQIDYEFLAGDGNEVTRYVDYAYDGAGESEPGMLRSVTEKETAASTAHLKHIYAYDEAMRPESVASMSPSGAYPELSVSMAYNFRGFMTDMVRGPPLANSDIPSVRVHFDHDDYGQLRSEKVEEGTGSHVDDFAATSTHSHFHQSWDGIGRRAGLSADSATLPSTLPANFNGQYGFSYNASGQLGTITSPYGHTASFQYSDNGFLHTRELSHRDGDLTKSISIPLADGRRADGRILKRLSASPTVSNLLSETLDFYDDGRVQTFQAKRGVGTGSTWANYTETRGYQYNSRGQLTDVSGVKKAPALAAVGVNYGFDADKLGVRTSSTLSDEVSKAWNADNGELDAFGRIDIENIGGDVVEASVSLEGNALGAKTVELSLNGAQISNAVLAGEASGSWSLAQSLVPGDYELTALARHAHPQSTFTVQDAVNFEINGGDEAGVLTESVYDGSGRTVFRSSRNGQVQQTLAWDAAGKLIKVRQVNYLSALADVPSYEWVAVYDPLGRRIRSTYTPLDADKNPLSAQAVASDSWYDPQVEFLELVVETGGERYWKLYGPDFDVGYGGFNGVGGLEAVEVESSGEWHPLVLNQFGHVVASIDTQGNDDNADDSVAWREIVYDGYGVLPGFAVPTLASLEVGQSFVDTLLWQGKCLEPTGWYRMGAREYDPVAGNFLSPDPAGHLGSMDLYSYASGDPINRIDHDGRIDVSTFNSQMLSYSLPQDRGSAFQQIGDWAYGIYDTAYSFLNPSESLYQRDQRNGGYYSFRQDIPIIQQQMTDLAITAASYLPITSGFVELSRGNYSGALLSWTVDIASFGVGSAISTGGRVGYSASRGAFTTSMKRFTQTAPDVVRQADNVAPIRGADVPYNPRDIREALEVRYGAGNVTSTTIPAANIKNVKLAGQRHPVTGVVFDQRGFPIFDDVAGFDTSLDIAPFRAASYTDQMRMATQALRDSGTNLSRFSAVQRTQIQNGASKIDGFTWHHHQNTGRMQLVPTSIHSRTGHVGWEGMSQGK